MKDTNKQSIIFRQGSTTYYGASFFFPKPIREKVSTLYAFVRLADNFIDQVPADEAGFANFVDFYTLVRQKNMFGMENPDWIGVIVDFVHLQDEVGIEDEWVEAFFAAMRADLTKKTYHTISETVAYMYGSAEVIGLMLSAIFSLPKAAYPAAQMLGRAMQYANFLRDIADDEALGRQYIPVEVCRRFGFSQLSKSKALAHPEQFAKLMHHEIARYQVWQAQAEKGYHFLPARIRIAVITAAQMYSWTLAQIEKQPLLVFEKKVKPTRSRIFATGLVQSLTALYEHFTTTVHSSN